MSIPRLLHSLWCAGVLSVRGSHAVTGLMLTFALAASLACDESVPTETRAPSQPSETGAAGDRAGLAADVTAMAIALPVNQRVATTAPAPAFRVQQTGSGPDGIFQISNSANSQPALHGLTNGRGRAGFFRIANAVNAQAALDAQTNGSGFAVQGIATGNGTAAAFRISSASNAKTALVAKTVGTGPAGLFETTNIDNPSPALLVRTVGTGPAIHAITTNDGDFVEAVGTFEAAVNGSAIFASANSSIYYALHARGRPLAAHFQGKVDVSGNLAVTGTLTKGAGSFKIDHPLDPEHKYLSHSFVESPDMMNVYNGNVTLDADGRATVGLPVYFEALNRDFRYQLTAIGAPGPNLYIAEGVKQNRFRIAGGRAYARVSWQVTGIRHDAYAEEHRIKVEEDKAPAEGELVARR
jgi:hypothetical protein